jgi:hypothetical protein
LRPVAYNGLSFSLIEKSILAHLVWLKILFFNKNKTNFGY